LIMITKKRTAVADIIRMLAIIHFQRYIVATLLLFIQELQNSLHHVVLHFIR
jgi:hypothetical protein